MANEAQCLRPVHGAQQGHLYPPYGSTVRRSPSQPLTIVPQTLTEVTGRVFGHEDGKAGDFHLTQQHGADPIGERNLSSAELDRLFDLASYSSAAGAFVDRAAQTSTH